MNEKIRELIEQATEPPVFPANIGYFNREKFALLILQECLVLFENAKVNQEDDVDYGLEEAKNIIKEYFGVDE